MKVEMILSKWGAETVKDKAARLGVEASYDIIREDAGTYPLCQLTLSGEESAVREAAKGYQTQITAQ